MKKNISIHKEKGSLRAGFIGLGKMGSGIAKNLLSHDISLLAYDKNLSALRQFKNTKLENALTPAEIASQVSIIFLCLPFIDHVNNVLFGKNGVIEGSFKDLTIVDMSTLYFDDALRISKELESYNIVYCDCPISGLPERALNGSLTIMFGGTRRNFKNLLKWLNFIGDFVVYCGECGSGQKMKAFNNILYNINIAGISEILPLAYKAGLDVNALEKVFTSGSSRSFASEHFVPKMLKREFTGDYQMDAAMKDLENVKKAILTFPGSKPMLEGMVSVYDEAIKNGFGNKSKSAMLKVYEQRFNISLKNK